AEDKECTGRHGGKYYDLSPLKGKDHKLTTLGGHDVVLSACQSVKKETWGHKLEDPAKIGGFMRGDHGDMSLGCASSFRSPRSPRARTAKMREACVSTAIEFVCDPSAAQSSPRLVAILPPGDDDDACAFFFEWRTTYACPTSKGSTFGGFMWFLFISALTLLGAYLVIGTLYNFSALSLGGMDALPRFSLAGMCYHAAEALAACASGSRARAGATGRPGAGADMAVTATPCAQCGVVRYCGAPVGRYGSKQALTEIPYSARKQRDRQSSARTKDLCVLVARIRKCLDLRRSPGSASNSDEDYRQEGRRVVHAAAFLPSTRRGRTVAQHEDARARFSPRLP
ncbi:hypothetical protein C8J57DRAFT_1057657, partial [Mycena rebaudengoi]